MAPKCLLPHQRAKKPTSTLVFSRKQPLEVSCSLSHPSLLFFLQLYKVCGLGCTVAQCERMKGNISQVPNQKLKENSMLQPKTKLKLNEHRHQSKIAKEGRRVSNCRVTSDNCLSTAKKGNKIKGGGEKEAGEMLKAFRLCSYITRKKKKEGHICPFISCI